MSNSRHTVASAPPFESLRMMRLYVCIYICMYVCLCLCEIRYKYSDIVMYDDSGSTCYDRRTLELSSAPLHMDHEIRYHRVKP